MKKYVFIIHCCMALFFTSCNVLNIENLTDYDANSVWSDEKLSTAYVNDLYSRVFTNWDSGADQNSEQVTGMPFYANVITVTGSSYKTMTSGNYTIIRLINSAIAEIAAGGLEADVKESLTAQALFMRAYVYFNMVLYHGGVPYLKVAQDKAVDDLLLPRNSTAECYQFIVDDLDQAIAGLPEKISSSSADYGRIDQTFAKAFKAKVLLYKASPQFNPSHPYDNAYWAEAYTAAKEAYDFAKAHGSALTASYDNIFLVEGGPEVLFAVINSYPSKTGSWDWYLRPQSLSTGQIQRGPTWDMIKSFPMADGKTWDDPTGKYYVSSEALLMQSFWKNRDPRFYSSVTCPGQLYPVAGRDASFRIYTALGLADDADAYGTNPHSGGAVSTKNDSYGGFFVRKAIDFSLTPDQSDEYSIDCVKMRFAELMFIYAEAANENGHSDVAVQMLKEIRQRAGLEAGDDGNYGLPANPTRDQIRDLILAERNTELCFEGFRFWDLRRTRHLDKLYGLQKFGLESIAINADGSEMDINDAKAKAKAFELTPDNFKYVKQMCPYTPSAENTFVVNESFYFFPIQQTLLDENPNLEQNNTWGGTFDPTME